MYRKQLLYIHWKTPGGIRQVELKSQFTMGRASISVSMPACHAGEQGSTPWRGALKQCTLPKPGQKSTFSFALPPRGEMIAFFATNNVSRSVCCVYWYSIQ